MSKFTAQTYDMVAKAINDEVTDNHGPFVSTQSAAIEAMHSLASRFVIIFEADNENFDRERFLVAAGLIF